MKEYITDKYTGAYFKTYADDKAKRISDGWKVEDINLLQKDSYMNGVCFGNYVTGNVVYSREKGKNKNE